MAYIRRYDRHPLLLPPNMVPSAWDDVEIDWSHPLSRGLSAHVFVQNGVVADLTKNLNFQKGTGTVSTIFSGPVLNTVSLTDSWTAVLPPSMFFTGDFSLVWGGITRSSGGSGLPWIFGCDNAADSTRNWIFYTSGSSLIFVCAGNNYTSSTSNYGYGALCATLNLSSANSALYKANMYFNGSSLTTGNVGGGGQNVNYSSSPLVYFGGGANTTNSYGLIYNRQLPASEVAWLSSEPFAMLAPRKVISYYTASSLVYAYLASRAFAASRATAGTAATGLIGVHGEALSSARASNAAASSLAGRATAVNETRASTAASAKLAAHGEAISPARAADTASASIAARAPALNEARAASAATANVAGRATSAASGRGGLGTVATLASIAGRSISSAFSRAGLAATGRMSARGGSNATGTNGLAGGAVLKALAGRGFASASGRAGMATRAVLAGLGSASASGRGAIGQLFNAIATKGVRLSPFLRGVSLPPFTRGTKLPPGSS